MIGERVTRFSHPPRKISACFIACWTEIGRVFGINSPSMAALFDIDVICGEYGGEPKVRNDIGGGRKSSGARERERSGSFFFLFVRVMSLTEETVAGKSNLGARALPLPDPLRATRNETAKPALITFRETKNNPRFAKIKF